MSIGHAVTRSVRDSAALLDAVSGPEAGDPYAAPAPARPFLHEVGADPGRLRIAFSGRPPSELPGHADCIAAMAAPVSANGRANTEWENLIMRP